MTHDAHDHDFRQFAGRFEAPVAPSPAFAADLRSRLGVATFPASVPYQAVATESSQPAPLTAAAPQAIDDEPWRAPRWMRALEAAVAVLLVVSLAGASLYFRQPATVYDLAFQPTDTAAEFNVGGDPGRTWDLGNVEPETGGYRIDPNIPLAEMQFANVGYARLIIEDSFVFSTGPDNSEGSLVRYDLERSEQVWTSSAIAAGQLASDGERIFAFQSDTMPETNSATLIAIDFETGDVIWEGPTLASTPNGSLSLVLSNGTVFAADYLGNIVAVNSNDGSSIWQHPETLAVPSVNMTPTEVPIGGEVSSLVPEVIANDDAIFVGLPSKAVLKLDRESGADLGSIDLLDEYGEDIVFTTIQVRADRLVIAAVHAEQKDDQGDIFGYFPTNILVFDAESLQLQTRTDVRNYGGNIVLMGDAALVPTSMEPDGVSSVYRLDFATGELGEPLLGIQSTRGMLLSASGDVLMVTGYPSSIGFFDLDTGDLINSFELETPILETPFNQQIHMWNSNPITITSLGGIYVIEDEPAS